MKQYVSVTKGPNLTSLKEQSLLDNTIIFTHDLQLTFTLKSGGQFVFYATLPYIRHFIFAGCYDNNPCYLVTNLAGHLDFAGHLDLAGFYFSKCLLILNAPLNLLQDRIFILSWRKPKFKYIEFAWA
jgi:hypothetical protein